MWQGAQSFMSSVHQSPSSPCLLWAHPFRGSLESDTTERLPFQFSLSCIGEGNGTPLQCSCLENPRMGEPGGLLSMGLHRVGHDWSTLAAAVWLKSQYHTFWWFLPEPVVFLWLKKTDPIYNYFIVLKICWTLNLDLVTRAAWLFVSSVPSPEAEAEGMFRGIC